MLSVRAIVPANVRLGEDYILAERKCPCDRF